MLETKKTLRQIAEEEGIHLLSAKEQSKIRGGKEDDPSFPQLPGGATPWIDDPEGYFAVGGHCYIACYDGKGTTSKGCGGAVTFFCGSAGGNCNAMLPGTEC